ncbi:hypothetical protein HJC23_011986 [Cyclotella cryptica]|uniref:Succinate dehydrogenase assembly factor 4, mitochondrial n=1 Tax=Cyclotella cryptica TaxID=29204 RepID=A0ABD3QQF5_9STRA|eukprot:CCRYP_003048-RA/>CCRYP_003048-RA protein AED:0.02 eAED:0.02 QI:270/-1/1/1/-1/1/1/375/152
MIRLIAKPLPSLTVFGTFRPPARPIEFLTTNREISRSSVMSDCMIHISKRCYHRSVIYFKSGDIVFVTKEKSRDESATANAQHVSLDSNKACGTPPAENDEDEMEQEEMFVTADPILGHGEILEWGGPRRGGSLMEPTRFGDWERKGRCTDF